jgi:hypothetical protein
MAFDTKLLDQYGNPFRGFIDVVGGETVTETGRTYTQTLSSQNADVIMDLNGASVANFDVRATAANLTLVFEGSIDGTNYYALPAWTVQAVIGASVFAEQYVASAVILTTATALYTVGVSGFKKVRAKVSAYTSGAVVVAARASIADLIIYGKPIPSELSVQIDGGANATTTITLPAAGVGLFHYITSLSWHRHSTAALVGTGAFNITTTNLPGTMKWRVGNAIAVGEHKRDVELTPATPVKSLVANTNTTIVAAAAGAAVLTTGLCTYYVGA